jgi:hypothetical protein
MSLALLSPKTKKKYFQAVIKTDNTSSGSSNDNQFKLPLESTGTYDFWFYPGDGSKYHITTYNQAETLYTYSAIGTYNIRIYGTCKGLRFNNTGDRLKILYINKWGNLQLGNSGTYFYGCTNLNISAIDIINNSTMTSNVGSFRNCSNLNYIVNYTQFANISSVSLMYANCAKLNQPIVLNTANVTTFYGFLSGCSIYNQPIVLNTANVTDMSYLFENCALFNQYLDFNTVKVTTMANMLYGCAAFNQDISNLSLKLVATMSNMLTGATSWSRANYDLFLIGAHAQALSTGVQSNVPFRCVPGYTLGGAAQAARDYLSSTKGWIFTDGGGV